MSRRLTPRWTIRLRLTVLYSGVFLLAGAVLLAIVYVLVSHQAVSETQVVKVPGDALIITKAGVGSGSAATLPLPPPPVAGVAGIVVSGTAGKPAAAPSKAAVQGPRYFQFGNARSKLEQAVGAERARERSRLLLWSGIALALMSVISAVLGWLMAGRALAPMRTMTARARRISEQNLHERLALAGPADELKELADTFDGVLNRLEGAFDAQRRFVANASHELRTPVTLARATAEVALADPGADVESLRQACEAAVVTAEQQERLIEGLLTLARSGHGLAESERIDLRADALAAIDAVAPAVNTRGLQLESRLDPACVDGDPRLIERLVANLLDNAARHNVDGGWISVRTGLGADGCSPVLIVANSGVPIDAVEAGRLPEPFRRGGAGRGERADGHGLGLSIVAAIAEAHSAALTVSPLPNGGLEVSVAFKAPRAATPAPSGTAPSAPTRTPSTGPRLPSRLRRSATSRSG
jgi:signal transduction histidine kinase